MATKKKAPPKKEIECFRCDGTGQICNICGESEKVCGCSAHEVETYIEENDGIDQFDDCEDCGGTGK